MLLAEIGIGLTGFGFVLTFLGVLFFFDKGLLAMGNVRYRPGCMPRFLRRLACYVLVVRQLGSQRRSSAFM